MADFRQHALNRDTRNEVVGKVSLLPESELTRKNVHFRCLKPPIWAVQPLFSGQKVDHLPSGG